LGTLGGSPTGPPIDPRAINTDREVVGNAWAADGFAHAFLWSGASMQDLGAVGQQGFPLGATGINVSGQVVGNSQAADGTTHAWRYTLAKEELGTLPDGTSSWALHIDQFRNVEGLADQWVSDGSGNPPMQIMHAVRWHGGPIPPDDLGALKHLGDSAPSADL